MAPVSPSHIKPGRSTVDRAGRCLPLPSSSGVGAPAGLGAPWAEAFPQQSTVGLATSLEGAGATRHPASPTDGLTRLTALSPWACSSPSPLFGMDMSVVSRRLSVHSPRRATAPAGETAPFGDGGLAVNDAAWWTATPPTAGPREGTAAVRSVRVAPIPRPMSLCRPPVPADGALAGQPRQSPRFRAISPASSAASSVADRGGGGVGSRPPSPRRRVPSAVAAASPGRGCVGPVVGRGAPNGDRQSTPPRGWPSAVVPPPPSLDAGGVLFGAVAHSADGTLGRRGSDAGRVPRGRVFVARRHTGSVPSLTPLTNVGVLPTGACPADVAAAVAAAAASARADAAAAAVADAAGAAATDATTTTPPRRSVADSRGDVDSPPSSASADTSSRSSLWSDASGAAVSAALGTPSWARPSRPRRSSGAGPAVAGGGRPPGRHPPPAPHSPHHRRRSIASVRRSSGGGGGIGSGSGGGGSGGSSGGSGVGGSTASTLSSLSGSEWTTTVAVLPPPPTSTVLAGWVPAPAAPHPLPSVAPGNSHGRVNTYATAVEPGQAAAKASMWRRMSGSLRGLVGVGGGGGESKAERRRRKRLEALEWGQERPWGG